LRREATRRWAFLWIVAAASAVPVAAGGAEARHAIAMHGEPAWAQGFSATRYANPAAPKGGRLTEGILGTFDSLNPFIVKGLAVQHIRGYVIESLMARGYDEPFTLYGLLATSAATSRSGSTRRRGSPTGGR
jgi:peptide/nickel transport system substrate-binding protein